MALSLISMASASKGHFVGDRKDGLLLKVAKGCSDNFIDGRVVCIEKMTFVSKNAVGSTKEVTELKTISFKVNLVCFY